mgnify:CR=1 FL=1
MKKEKQQKRPKRTKAQRVQALKTFAVDTVYDVVGSILFAIGVYTFAKSADFAPGGVSGLALICNYLWDLPIGTMTLIINIPIIIISYKVVGRKFLLKSFKTMVISTLFLDLVFPLTPLYTGNSFLAAIFSGVFMGAGLALIYMLVHRRHGFPHRHHQKAQAAFLHGPSDADDGPCCHRAGRFCVRQHRRSAVRRYLHLCGVGDH